MAYETFEEQYRRLEALVLAELKAKEDAKAALYARGLVHAKAYFLKVDRAVARSKWVLHAGGKSDDESEV